MTLNDIEHATTLLITLIVAVAIVISLLDRAFTKHHERKAAKAQTEYWQKKTAQIENAATQDRS